MKLSVIIPYYNSDAWIAPLLDSLLDQDIPQEDYEIIVVDDGSPQEPVTLKRYAAEHPNIVYVRQANARVSAARNHGLALARGEWVYFCDADDLLQRKVLGRLVEAARADNCDMIFGHALLIGDQDPLPEHPKRNFQTETPVMTGPEYLRELSDTFSFGVWQFPLLRSFLMESGVRFREDIQFTEDRFFFLEVAMKARRVKRVDVDLYYYVQRQSSIIHDQRKIKCGVYSESFLRYIDQLSDYLRDPSIPEVAKPTLENWRNFDAYGILFDVFRYLPASRTEAALDRLERQGVMPLRKMGAWLKQTIVRLMNHRRLWLLLCRIYHILPLKWRLRH